VTTSDNARIGVVLTNLGGPPTLDAVEPFLRNLFADRDIIQLPCGAAAQPVFARLIAAFRGPSVRRHYAGIGGGSPQLSLTIAQADALARRLNGPTDRYRTYVAMRYWHPLAEETFERVEADGIRRVVVLTLYPQYSMATTGSMERDLARLLALPRWRDRFTCSAVRSYATHPGYIAALADSVRRGLDAYPAERRDGVVLLFSAHGLPVRIVKRGDPYLAETEATRQRVVAALSVPNRHVLAFQSRTGPVRWIGPGTGSVIDDLAREGVDDVLAIPVSFVSDHIETLYELDQLYDERARRAGITGFSRAKALNTNPLFIDALADVVERHLEETR
jgi:ferrochelatase